MLFGESDLFKGDVKGPYLVHFVVLWILLLFLGSAFYELVFSAAGFKRAGVQVAGTIYVCCRMLNL